MSESERPVVIRTAPRAPIPLAKAAVVLDDRDTIAIAKEMLVPGTELVDNTWHLRIAQAIPTGHKVALRPIRSGEAVLRYGQIIGFATTDIEAGTHVHTHNLSSERGRGDLASTLLRDGRIAEPDDIRRNGA